MASEPQSQPQVWHETIMPRTGSAGPRVSSNPEKAKIRSTVSPLCLKIILLEAMPKPGMGYGVSQTVSSARHLGSWRTGSVRITEATPRTHNLSTSVWIKCFMGSNRVSALPNDPNQSLRHDAAIFRQSQTCGLGVPDPGFFRFFGSLLYRVEGGRSYCHDQNQGHKTERKFDRYLKEIGQ